MTIEKAKQIQELVQIGQVLLSNTVFPHLEAFSENALYCGRGIPTMNKYKTVKEVCDLIFISHAECEEDAKHLADILMQRHGAEVTLITEIGPVIGSHAGPGTLAIFFIGKHR